MDPLIAEKSLKCIRCGFCLDACPTFRLTGNEADSPRGRIYLMRSVAEGVIPLEPGVVSHIDRCLGCRACETACPSGVQYGLLLEHFRAEVESGSHRPEPRKLARRQLLDLLTNPKRMALALRGSRLLARMGFPQKSMPAFAAEMLTGQRSVPVELPSSPEEIKVGKLPEIAPAKGEARARVVMLEGCVTRVLFHPANEATMRVLQRAGCTVLAPAAMGCCGALHLHAGFAEEARAKMRRLVDALKGEMFDALIVNSAGCGSTLKEIGEILKDDDAYAEPAAEIARKVRDVCEFLAEMEQPTFTGTFNEVTAYHDACHLCHGQKITAQPRELLRRVPGLTLVDLPESDTCCGSAGIYNLTQPQMAQQLLQRKIDHIRGTGATVIATGNPGCTAWIRKGCDDAGLKVRVMHPIEILDAAMR